MRVTNESWYQSLRGYGQHGLGVAGFLSGTLNSLACTIGGMKPRPTLRDPKIKKGADLTHDEVAENMNPERLQEAQFKHGNLETWKYKGEKPTSGRQATDKDPGTIKVYEIWKNAAGKEFELHYFKHLDGTLEDLKEKPRTR